MPHNPSTPFPIPDGRGDRPELVLVMKKEAGIRALGSAVESTTGSDTGPLADLLETRHAALRPLFGLSEGHMKERIGSAGVALEAAGPVPTDDAPVPDLSLYYRVVTDEDRLDELAADLRADDLVEAAYIKPAGEPPALLERPRTLNDMQPDVQAPPPTTPDFRSHQTYLDTAPAGVDAWLAWTIPGGGGQGISVIDCEWGWRFTHEDLSVGQRGVVAGTSSAHTDHGTAVIGVVGGDRNAYGITGIAPEATVGASSFADQSTGQAIRAAADRLAAGDIILLEIHRPGPNSPVPPNGQFGFIAVEWWPDDFAAIRYAVAKGIVVVEAAGNGAQNLDDAVYSVRPTGFPTGWTNPFDLGNPQSGAVLVGAGAPPPDTHGADHGPDRSRLGFSNYGSRVDAQGWGREVTSTGYGDLQGGWIQDRWYTDRFSGTSSASPVVTGALACLQGMLRARGHHPLTSSKARQLLRSTGSPQTDAPGRPASQRIGNRPDIRQMVAAAGIGSRAAEGDQYCNGA